MNNIYNKHNLEAEPVSLTYHSVLRKLFTFFKGLR
jgi:hypothetical protein